MKRVCLITALMLGLAAPAMADLTVFSQGFEANTDDMISYYSTIDRVASGTGGIASADGSYHAVLSGAAQPHTGVFTRFDGYRDTWTGPWTARVDVYLDTSWADGAGFDYSVAANGSDGDHQRDYIFHVAKDSSSGQLIVAGSNNSNFATRQDLDTLNNHVVVADSGWYTLEHKFYDNGGALAADLNLVDSVGTVLFTETRYNAADLIPSLVGGNRYGWFTFVNVQGGLAIDNVELGVVPAPGAALLGFIGLGMVRWTRRRTA